MIATCRPARSGSCSQAYRTHASGCRPTACAGVSAGSYGASPLPSLITRSISPSNPDAQPTTRSPGRCSGCRLAITSPATSWIGKPSFSAALRPSSPGSRALGAAKGRQVAAADTGGQEPQQHLTVGQVVGRLVGDRRALEQIRGDDPVGPHVRPPPGSCSIPTGSWTAAGWRRRLGSRSRAPAAAIPVSSTSISSRARW